MFNMNKKTIFGKKHGQKCSCGGVFQKKTENSNAWAECNKCGEIWELHKPEPKLIRRSRNNNV
jgi:hypothetical protein